MEIGIVLFLSAIGAWMLFTSPRFRDVAFGYVAMFCVIMLIVALLTGQVAGKELGW